MTMQQSQRRLIIVLGMHRSGTSAIARGLMALGADLGENLLPPVPENNERGFWEDREVVALSDAVLDRLGLAWDSAVPIDRARLAGGDFADLRLRALDLVRSRLDDRPIFALKDPRLSRLMPFWSAVFQRLDARVDYVLCLRNPISAAQSLRRRDGFAAIKSHLLWLQHSTAMVLDTASVPPDPTPSASRRPVVSFERLLAAPQAELERLARVLGLDFDASSDAVRDYLTEFLDRGLEHAHYAETDLSLDPALPAAVAETFAALGRAAGDPAGGLDAEVESVCRQHEVELARLAPLLQFAAESDRVARRLEAAGSQRDRELQATKDLLADRQARVVALSKLLDLLENKLPAGFGRHLATLAGDIARDSRQPVLDGLAQAGESVRSALAESEARLAVGLKEGEQRILLGLGDARERLAREIGQLGESFSHIAEVDRSLRHGLDALAADGKDTRQAIQRLEEASRTRERDLAERSREIAKLSQLLLESQSAGHVAQQARDDALQALNALRGELRSSRQAGDAARQRLAAVEHSLSWALTAPLRWPAGAVAWLREGRWRQLRDAREIARSGLFDADWYLRTYPDVAAIAMPPIHHYLRHGAGELRDPGPEFSTRGYLRANPDVAQSGINPLLHYVRHGRDEGRSTGIAGQ